jgi:hypothetical protein
MRNLHRGAKGISALGHKQTFAVHKRVSTLPLKACSALANVRFGQKRTSPFTLVSATEIALIAGAANTTTGNIAIHATSQDDNQLLKNCTGLGDGKLAIPAAIKLVSPA